jgi:hypothetical protein
MWKQFRLMGPDAGAAAGGGADAAAAAAAAASAAAGGDGKGAAGGDGKGAASSALAMGGDGKSAAVTGLEFLQEKFHVKTADGKLDEAASIRKQAESYAELEKVRPIGEAPPATPAEYKLTMPNDLDQASFDEFVKDPATVAALEGMHKAGLNNKQVDLVMGMYLASAAQMAQGGQVLSAQDTITELGKTWKTEAELTKNIGAARHAATTLGTRIGVDFAAIEAAGLANNPTFIRMMTAPAGAALPETDLDSLVKSKAYMDPTDPNHKAVKEKVAQHFASLPGGANKPRGPVSISP